MKHIFFTLCFLCLTMMVVAQDNNTAQPSYRHHFEVSVSEPFSTLWGFNLQSTTKEKYHHYFHDFGGEFRPAMNKGYEDETFVPPLTVSYFYQPLHWLQVGGEIGTFSVKTRERYWNDKTYAHWLETNLYLAVGARFNYYHKNITDLYSGLTLGCNVRMASTHQDAMVFSQALFSWQLTALGIRFGRSVYGTVEVGYGYKGLISAGIGYRF